MEARRREWTVEYGVDVWYVTKAAETGMVVFLAGILSEGRNDMEQNRQS
jgi:hypothetical protein